MMGIYEESLRVVRHGRFSHDDYIALARCLEETEGIPGDCIEFGTFWGHSAWLTAQHLDGHRKLWLYDTFDTFPREYLEIDQKWSGTHEVEFESVQELFGSMPLVELVQGDFVRTARERGPEQISFCLVDCDSFRGTAFAAEWCWRKLAPGGMMLFQDYGKAHCRGATLAVDGFLLGHPEALVQMTPDGRLLEISRENELEVA